MGSVMFLSVVVVSMLFFVNFVAILKKVKNEKDTAPNTVAGAIMIGYIVYASLILAAS